jgi:predicted anti-sigma-YlaC factor YlaD
VENVNQFTEDLSSKHETVNIGHLTGDSRIGSSIMAREFNAEQHPQLGAPPCPPGTFQSLAEKLRKRRRRRLFLRNAVAVVSTAAVAGGGLSLWLGLKGAGQQDSGEYHFGGLACSEVQKLAGAYAKGELAPPMREQVRQHVAQCPRCQQMFRSMGMKT